MQSFILLAIALTASASVTMNFNVAHSFSAFKAIHAKQYTSASEEATRARIWSKNMDYITRHNSRDGVSFKLGMNQFGDLTNAEFQVQYLRPMNYSLKPKSKTVHVAANVANPSSVDWRTKGYVVAVKDQGQCGGCWAFSTTASTESANFKATGTLTSLSEQNLVDCSQKQGNSGCNGGLMDDGFQYIIDNGGIDTEASYPYVARDGACKYKAASSGATLSSFTDVESNSESALESASADAGTISIAIDASHNSFQFYKSGVYVEAACSSTDLDHGVAVVGYGVLSGKKYWIVRNSWAATWGQGGYILMGKDMDNQCGVATSASYAVA